jgi:tryptophan synthase alpha chain
VKTLPAVADTSRITSVFERLLKRQEKALIAYIMAGDPSLEDTEAYVLQLAGAGADIVELGVPFSDPIADGPVIQQAADRALRAGTTLKKILGTVQVLRTKTQIPIVLMIYYNTILKYGEAGLCRDAAQMGVDGLIVPDLPSDEAETLREAVKRPWQSSRRDSSTMCRSLGSPALS